MRHFLPQDKCLSELSVLAVEKSACYCYILIQSMLSSKTSDQTLHTGWKDCFNIVYLEGTPGKNRLTPLIAFPSHFRMCDKVAVEGRGKGWLGRESLLKEVINKAASRERKSLVLRIGNRTAN